MALRWVAKHVYGSLVPSLERATATDIHGLVDDMVSRAVLRWQSENWHRFDNLEVNCTIRLYYHALNVCRNRKELRALSPRLEWMQPTTEMLAGTSSAAGMPRPDLRVDIGVSAGLTIECKRLSLSDQHPQLYVSQGMCRFVTGRYAPDEVIGAMVGYVQADEPDVIVDAVNKAVDTGVGLGPAHRLKHRLQRSDRLTRYHSEHARTQMPELRLTHYIVDIR